MAIVRPKTGMLKVNGVAVYDPSTMSWGLQDVSDSQSGRTTDAVMHKNRIAQKEKIELSWSGLTKIEISEILQAFNPEYIMLTYHNPLLNQEVTKEYYVGDRSSVVWKWQVNNEIYEKVSFNCIER